MFRRYKNVLLLTSIPIVKHMNTMLELNKLTDYMFPEHCDENGI
jgi:hypothetical protein